ncbi:hypothetical protein H0H92_003552 [Tricholoma furcatifolium]|nr:hypothetical protein H0H92_003552 [Tricholoma furcatifolium]
MSENAPQKGHLRIVGAFAGVGSGTNRFTAWFVDAYTLRTKGPLALYKGATPPAVGWAAIDSVLLGSLHNYRLFLVQYGMTESTPLTGTPRLTLMGHGIAGLFAGLTSTGAANFISGGLGAFAFWGMAIPADNIKK